MNVDEIIMMRFDKEALPPSLHPICTRIDKELSSLVLSLEDFLLIRAVHRHDKTSLLGIATILHLLLL